VSGPTGEALSTLALWSLLAWALSLTASGLYPAFARLLRGGDPAGRALALLVYATLPPVAALLTAFFVMSPEWSAPLIPSHCHGDDCAQHQPALVLGHPVGATLAAGSVLLWLLVAAIGQRTLRRARRKLGMLRRLADSRAGVPYQVVDDPRPLAWCIGLLQPRVFLSRGLEAQLTDSELQLVLAHEFAHARRRDNLRQLLLRWASLAWQQQPRQRLLADFAGSTEQACDAAAAATAAGGREALMGLLQRLPAAARAADARLSFESLARPERLRALQVAAASHRPLTAAWACVALGWLAAPALCAGPAHYLLEWLTAL